MANSLNQRRRDLDFYRGFTIVQMVAAHLLMTSRAPMRPDETLRLFFFSYAEIFSAGFLMLAGVNVHNVIEKAKTASDFNLSRFYFLSSIGLFFMGWGYNLLEGTGPFTSVVQAIGVGVLVTYLFLRVGFPNWSLPFVAALFLLNYYLAVGARLHLSPDVHSHFFWRLLAGDGEMTKESLKLIWPTPYLFCMFGIVPVSGFVLMGVFIERLRRRNLVAACVVFFAMAIVSHFMPELAFNKETHPVLRADMKLLFQILPLYTGWLLTFRYLYPKARRTGFTNTVEQFGRQSLDFLIFHWIFINVAILLTPTLKDSYGFSAAQWLRAVIVIFFLYLILPWFDGLRRRVSAKPNFLRTAWTVLLAAYVIAVLSSGAKVLVVRVIAGAVAAVTFTLMYPAQRESWRKSSMQKTEVDTTRPASDS